MIPPLDTHISSLDGTSSSYPIYIPGTNKRSRLPEEKPVFSLSFDALTMPVLYFLGNSFFLTAEGIRNTQQKNVLICDLCNHIEPIRTFIIFIGSILESL